jgi:hypothetical protein
MSGPENQVNRAGRHKARRLAANTHNGKAFVRSAIMVSREGAQTASNLGTRGEEVE